MCVMTERSAACAHRVDAVIGGTDPQRPLSIEIQPQQAIGCEAVGVCRIVAMVVEARRARSHAIQSASECRDPQRSVRSASRGDDEIAREAVGLRRQVRIPLKKAALEIEMAEPAVFGGAQPERAIRVGEDRQDGAAGQRMDPYARMHRYDAGRSRIEDADVAAPGADADLPVAILEQAEGTIARQRGRLLRRMAEHFDSTRSQDRGAGDRPSRCRTTPFQGCRRARR